MQQVSRQASCWSVFCPLFCVHRLSAADVIPHVAWIYCVDHPPVETLGNSSLTPPVPKYPWARYWTHCSIPCPTTVAPTVTPVDHMGLCVCVNVIKHCMNVCDWWMRFLVRKYFECSNKYKGMTFASINICQKPQSSTHLKQSDVTL